VGESGAPFLHSSRPIFLGRLRHDPEPTPRNLKLAALSALLVLTPLAAGQRGGQGGGGGGGGGRGGSSGGASQASGGGGSRGFSGGSSSSSRGGGGGGGGGSSARSAPSSGGARGYSAPARSSSSPAPTYRSAPSSSAPSSTSSRGYSYQPGRSAAPSSSAADAPPSSAPQSGPVIRYAPAGGSNSSGSERPSGPSSRVFDTSDVGTSDRSGPDLSSWGKAPRTPIPVLSGSSARRGVPRAPARPRRGPSARPTAVAAATAELRVAASSRAAKDSACPLPRSTGERSSSATADRRAPLRRRLAAKPTPDRRTAISPGCAEPARGRPPPLLGRRV
jgi:hypothetical protein